MTLVPANLSKTLKNVEVADTTIQFNTITFEKTDVIKYLKICKAQTLEYRTFFENENALAVCILRKHEIGHT